MTRKEKESQALLELQKAYYHVSEAIVNGKIPDFALFETAKLLAEEAQYIIDKANCIQCNKDILIGTDTYTRVFIHQLNKCSGNIEEIKQPKGNKKELLYCSSCQEKILQFTENTTENEQEDNEDLEEESD